MTDSPREARVENPPPDYSGLRIALVSVLIIITLLLLWEGAKAFGASNNYAITIGSTEIDLTLLNNTQLPHLTDILRAFGEPAQRNGPPLYQSLIESAAFTLWAAVRGFFLGGLIGFALAILFAHSSFMQRGLLPSTGISWAHISGTSP